MNDFPDDLLEINLQCVTMTFKTGDLVEYSDATDPSVKYELGI